ncbi:hypothetical protein LJR220_003724 [Bradyrhizobium sp. LjRoot220]|uniref:hypothetical protein n=1 Tax=Bradyrhizobium sp. LjRoot220 TaxID=3342284 RepID=UPI003ED03842
MTVEKMRKSKRGACGAAFLFGANTFAAPHRDSGHSEIIRLWSASMASLGDLDPLDGR